jgi:hypothetical protein
MLYKEHIMKILKDINLSLNEYWISSGAALVIHGVKESTSDIDLGCTTNLIEYFIKKGNKYRVTKDNSRIVEINESVELIENWFVDEIGLIDGLPVASIESIRKQKAELGREKDIKDIMLIDEYIKHMGETAIIKDVYETCPIYRSMLITLRQTNMEDANDLLKCYCDEKAVPFFNSDNCDGDNFYYTAIERMRQGIEFWEFSYRNKYFVRRTVILNDTNEKIGTTEMFHRIANDEFNHYGVLRIDLQSDYERKSIIADTLEISNEHFYKAFDVEGILSKAIPSANQRITSLLQNGYKPLNKKLMIYDNYYVRVKDK